MIALLAGIGVLAMCLAVIRIVRGPTMTDRVIALDVVVIASAAVLALLAWMHDDTSLLDVVVAMSLVSFIGTAAAAWHVERRDPQ